MFSSIQGSNISKNVGKVVDKNISKSLGGKYSPGMLARCQKLFDHAKKSSTDALKTFSKELFKKQQKKLVIWLVIKLLIKSQNFQKFRTK